MLDLNEHYVLYLQIPGVPIMYITQHKYSIERLPEATIGGGMYSLCLLVEEGNIYIDDLI